MRHNQGDTVNYGTGWTVEIPQIVDGQYVHVLTQGTVTIQIVNTITFQNPFQTLDTIRNGAIAPSTC